MGERAMGWKQSMVGFAEGEIGIASGSLLGCAANHEADVVDVTFATDRQPPDGRGSAMGSFEVGCRI